MNAEKGETHVINGLSIQQCGNAFFFPYAADYANKLMYIVPICAVSFLVITGPLLGYIRRNWRCIRRENGHGNGRQPLNRGNVRDYGANHLNEPAEEKGPDNSQNEPQPSSASNRPCSNVRVANKDNFNRGSNRHHDIPGANKDNFNRKSNIHHNTKV